MNTVIKGIMTEEGYKKLRINLEQRANELYDKHKKVWEEWRAGEIVKIWLDSDSNLCIAYESGNWWHYNEKGEWW